MCLRLNTSNLTINTIVISISFFILSACSPQLTEQKNTEITATNNLEKWRKQADKITIYRDDWGIPHVYGKSDADAVFGMIYAQAEDDFNRIEVNYLNALGRLAEAEGESALYKDLRMKLFIDPDSLKLKFEQSPPEMQALMVAFADGLNYFLETNPKVVPKVINHFEPWMALAFTEGSIGGDIEVIDINKLQRFYQGQPEATLAMGSYDLMKAIEPEPTGSNGFAIAPSNTANNHALLLINPHTSFYFRSEMHMVSEQGLNAYGAVTWGQFFIYQGFNANAGWMHTSSGVDAIDYYEETIVEKDGELYYQYGDELKPIISKEITLSYKTGEGIKQKTITAHYTHHGPVIAGDQKTWLTISLMQEPVKALQQSYLRTKATDYDSFNETMKLHTNSSNNTVFADSSGNIAYFHGNFIPKRDPAFDWRNPVDGSNPKTDWQGIHSLEETIHIVNPTTGWLQNTNNWPYSVTGEASPKQEDFPPYMDYFPENYRGLNAVRLLENTKDFTLSSLTAAAYDSYLMAFDDFLPILFDAYEQLDDAQQQRFAEQVDLLKKWDRRSSVDSIETTLAIYWGRDIREHAIADKVGIERVRTREITFNNHMLEVAKKHATSSLMSAVNLLKTDFGQWKMAWGDVNRFQRLTGDIVQPFNDKMPSYPVGFASARWGSLAAFGQRTFNNTKKTYGTRGNSFVAVVEFGDKVKAKAITAGGQSGDVNSTHFDDQALLYSQGKLRDVYYYLDDVKKAAKRTYKPGLYGNEDNLP